MTTHVSKGELPFSILLVHLNPDAGLFYLLSVIFMQEGQKTLLGYKDWFTEALKMRLFRIEE